jgi:hypothetical protein
MIAFFGKNVCLFFSDCSHTKRVISKALGRPGFLKPNPVGGCGLKLRGSGVCKGNYTANNE